MEDIWHESVAWVDGNADSIVPALLILLGAWAVVRFGGVAIRKTVSRSVRPAAHKNRAEELKREETVIQIVSGALNIIIWPLALILIIAQFGVNVGPLIAGAGVIGVALGFGAQSLVKDVISGLFIIAENQYAVGDVVDLDGTTGQVQHITLRSTVLRDLDGIVHHVPNGTIERASNYSSEHSGINLDVGIAYDSDLDKVIRVVNRVGKELAKDPDWQDQILETPSFLRVDNLGDSSIDIKITGSVKPLTQWDVTGELRKRLKIAFDKEGIEIPFPQRVIHQAKK
ncbi:MAG TPA: mechanosensitive ion channel family protein [Candidatus Saccharimonadales bacterium]|nr:mechanosensitive ion channel family protein [Candidatus Saccharimonadales bacterium]